MLSQTRFDYDVAEAAFLRREVADLEFVIQSLHRSRNEECADKTATLVLHIKLLSSELAQAETDRKEADEAETHALSVARSYRSFAAQGASKLDELQSGIQGVQVHSSIGTCACVHIQR